MSAVQHHPIILIAEDDKPFLDRVSAVFNTRNYDVICTQDGKEALNILLHEPLDLALLDVRLPCGNGMALCHIVKSDPRIRQIPVVLLAGEASLVPRVEGIRVGADDFLKKSLNLQELMRRVRSLLKLKFFQDEMEQMEQWEEVPKAC